MSVGRIHGNSASRYTWLAALSAPCFVEVVIQRPHAADRIDLKHRSVHRIRYLELAPLNFAATRARLDARELEAELGPLTVPAAL